VVVQAKVFSRKDCFAPAIRKWGNPKEIVHKVCVTEDVRDDGNMLNTKNAFSYRRKDLTIRGTKDSKWFMVWSR
jgi:hypothetical protein